MSTEDISNGTIAGQQSRQVFTYHDCIFLAKVAFENFIFDRCEDWYRQAIGLAPEDKRPDIEKDLEKMKTKQKFFTELISRSPQDTISKLADNIQEMTSQVCRPLSPFFATELTC